MGLSSTGTGRERAVLLTLWALAALGCGLGLADPPSDGSVGFAGQALDMARIVTTTALVIVLVLGPGLVLRARRRNCRVALGFVPLPGLALLVVAGSVAWLLAPTVAPRTLCAFALIPVLIWLLASVAGADGAGFTDAEERGVLLIVAAALGIAVARALWSLGPVGELLSGSIYRTLEVGDRPDSRISFGVVQLLAHGSSPFGALARAYFAPYNFSARGPLAGLASAPVVLLAGGRPPSGTAAHPWLPFDPQGFMAYRLAMETFACTAFLSLWTLTRRLAGSRAARLAVLIAATTPFLVHEVWFTWPKLLAASLVLLAAVSLIDERPLTAGLLAGLGFLVHPLALLSIPTLGLIALWPLCGARVTRPRTRSAFLLLTGTSVSLIAWRLANGAHYKQTEFVHYVTEAGRQKQFADQLLRALGGHPSPVTLGDWLADRAVSVGNTLVPMRLFFLSGHDPSINVVRPCYPLCAGHSPGIVHFFFQYWTTLPFGVGIFFFPFLLVSLAQAARYWRWPIIATVIVPFLVFAVYWGDASTGLLREGLQAWILTVVVAVAIQQHHDGFAWLHFAPIRAMLALRSVEVLLVAVLPTIVTTHQLAARSFRLSDAVALLVIGGLSAYLGLHVWRELETRV